MNISPSTFVISPVELKGLRCKISKKSHRRTRLLGWRKCVDADKDEKEELHPSMRAVVWLQQDESSKEGVADERIMSCPMEVVSEDEDGGMIMTCAWPDGPNLSHGTNDGQVTLMLGMQVQDEELLSIGTARVSFSDRGPTLLTFLPTKQSKNVRYEFDVTSAKLNTLLDLFDADWNHFVVDQLANAKKSNGTLLAENETPTSQYADNDWLWETNDFKSEKVDDFSFEPAERQMELAAAADRKARVKAAFDNGKSTNSIATASTCSSTNSDMSPEGRTDITAEGDAPGCGSTFAELIEIITRRNCVQKNFELCLEEFFDAADDNSFASDTIYSVSMCREVRKKKKTKKKSKKVRGKGAPERNVYEQPLMTNTNLMKKKKGVVNKLKTVEL